MKGSKTLSSRGRPFRRAALETTALLSLLCPALPASAGEAEPGPAQAQRVTILRDTYGVPHVFGHSDADAVFGMVYAQAEDDWSRVEWNFIDALGRRAEVEGEAALFRDLRARLYVDPIDLQARYRAAPPPLRALMDGWAAGLNFFLRTHPRLRPRLLTHFEPWMALAFTEGSIGGDIESISIAELASFYGHPAPEPDSPPTEPHPGAPPRPRGRGDDDGSNGFAIAPARSESGHALLLINPHTSFYFRPEIHVVSDEGLDAYGAVTWGQPFVYQGWNRRLGWMHTSGGADVIDEYLEQVERQPAGHAYRVGGALRPLAARPIRIRVRSGEALVERTITAYFTHRGPVVRRAADGRWVSVRLLFDPVPALQQSFARTKAGSLSEFRRSMDLRTNSSNSTVYADADGNIACFHGNFVPRRDPRFDYTRPVDGSDPAVDWQGPHPVDETIFVVNPRSGWIASTNNWPFSVAGPDSPLPGSYPRYMWSAPENPRGVHAVRLLSAAPPLSLEGLMALAYDPLLTAFEPLIPALLRAWEEAPGAAPLTRALAEPVALLRGWDFRSSVSSVPTALAVLWGQELLARLAAGQPGTLEQQLLAMPAAEQLAALERTLARLERDFGTWRTPWGEVNRFQRLSGEIEPSLDDRQASLPIGLAPGTWGALAAFGESRPRGTRRIYGDKGNSFVAVVELGPTVRARTLLAGGQSGDPASPHFRDQAGRYARGDFKPAWLRREDIERHLERRYHPGQ